MNTWMKFVWAVAGLIVVTCLIALGQGTGAGGIRGSLAGSAPDAGRMEYFTIPDPVRGRIEWGVRDGRSTVIYGSTPVAR